MTMLDRLSQAGVKVDKSLARFNGLEALYVKFLKKFPDDPNFNALCQAVSAGKFDDAFVSAHTLKGLSANLGMDSIGGVCATLCQKYRSSDLEGWEPLIETLKSSYDSIVSVIKQED